MKDDKEKEIIEGYKKKERKIYAERGTPKKIRAYWRKMMDSTQKGMSKGAQKIARMISWARSDNWRRKDRKKKYD